MADMFKKIDGVKVKLTDKEKVLEERKDAEWNSGSKERKKIKLRAKRQNLLIEADHKINYLIDNKSNYTESWQIYRQKLRDITKAHDLDNVTFPDKPKG